MKTIRRPGMELAYEITGAGPAVLCIQGVGVAGSGWQPQVDALAFQFQMIAFDNRGLGHSALGSEPLSIEAMAEDAIAIMDAEGIDRFHVMGHSMGGLIAQHVAVLARPRVKTLSLLCTFANGKDATALSLRMLLLSLRSRLGTRAMRRAGMLRMIMPPHYLRSRDQARLAAELGELFGRDLADQPPIVMTQLRAMGHYNAEPRLAELAGIPTLVVSGAHDPIAPSRLGRALAEKIAGARFIEFAEASHAVPIQCAAEVNALLLAHLRSGEQS